MKHLSKTLWGALVLMGLLLPLVAMGTPCGDISERGCCDGKVLNYCASDFLLKDECISSCGWNPVTQYYECEATGEDPSGAFPLSCSCTPKCIGKQCGSDGCGGTCGSCKPEETCDNGTCKGEQPAQPDSCQNACGGTSPDFSCFCDVLCEQTGDCCQDVCEACGICDSCLPNCEGKECGGDGCAGQCGTCNAGETCTNGQCSGPPPSGSCQNACGGISPDNSCYCDDLCLENGDCCEDSCQFCNICDDCTPSCEGMECGDNGCGELCGSCPSGETCTDGTCTPGSASGSCKNACGGPSPDQSCFCDDGCEEKGDCCPDVCAQCGICDNCSPTCAGKECGPDGCNGTCGVCPMGQACTNGVCTGTGSIGPTCKGLCGGKGQDGTCWCDAQCIIAGNCCPDVCDECGYCGNGACDSNCNGKECGDDGCGQPCGFCDPGSSCEGGTCTIDNPCTPNCGQKQCGNDGCNGSCGLCDPGQKCSVEGFCQVNVALEVNGSDRVTLDPSSVSTGNSGGPPTIQVEKQGCQASSERSHEGLIPLTLMLFFCLTAGRTGSNRTDASEYTD